MKRKKLLRGIGEGIKYGLATIGLVATLLQVRSCYLKWRAESRSVPLEYRVQEGERTRVFRDTGLNSRNLQGFAVLGEKSNKPSLIYVDREGTVVKRDIYTEEEQVLGRFEQSWHGQIEEIIGSDSGRFIYLVLNDSADNQYKITPALIENGKLIYGEPIFKTPYIPEFQFLRIADSVPAPLGKKGEEMLIVKQGEKIRAANIRGLEGKVSSGGEFDLENPEKYTKRNLENLDSENYATMLFLRIHSGKIPEEISAGLDWVYNCGKDFGNPEFFIFALPKGKPGEIYVTYPLSEPIIQTQPYSQTTSQPTTKPSIQGSGDKNE